MFKRDTIVLVVSCVVWGLMRLLSWEIRRGFYDSLQNAAQRRAVYPGRGHGIFAGRCDIGFLVRSSSYYAAGWFDCFLSWLSLSCIGRGSGPPVDSIVALRREKPGGSDRKQSFGASGLMADNEES